MKIPTHGSLEKKGNAMLGVLIPNYLHARLTNLATEMGTTKTNLVIRCLEKQLKEEEVYWINLILRKEEIWERILTESDIPTKRELKKALDTIETELKERYQK